MGEQRAASPAPAPSSRGLPRLKYTPGFTFTIAEAARRLGKNPKTIRAWMQTLGFGYCWLAQRQTRADPRLGILYWQLATLEVYAMMPRALRSPSKVRDAMKSLGIRTVKPRDGPFPLDNAKSNRRP